MNTRTTCKSRKDVASRQKRETTKRRNCLKLEQVSGRVLCHYRNFSQTSIRRLLTSRRSVNACPLHSVESMLSSAQCRTFPPRFINTGGNMTNVHDTVNHLCHTVRTARVTVTKSVNEYIVTAPHFSSPCHLLISSIQFRIHRHCVATHCIRPISGFCINDLSALESVLISTACPHFMCVQQTCFLWVKVPNDFLSTLAPSRRPCNFDFPFFLLRQPRLCHGYCLTH